MEISAMQVVASGRSLVSTSFFYSSAQLSFMKYKDRTVATILDPSRTAVVTTSKPFKMRPTHCCAVLSTFLCGLALAKQDPRLETPIVTETPINGVSTTPEGRTFLLYARVDGSTGPTVVESIGNTTLPYPNHLEWHSYNASKDPSTHFVRINSQRIGPDGQLWIVDVGSPAFGEPVILPKGPKLVAINLTTNEVSRVYPMGNVTLAQSLLDDIRFNPKSGKAYLTDAGVPALIVLDIASGDARRVLEYDVSTRGNMPVSAEGRLVRGAGGSLLYAYADQLEVSPDAMWLYYQSCDGGMYRIETKYLDHAFYNSSMASVLAQYPEPFASTPATGEFQDHT
jgi:hypothetical protein